MEVVTNWVRRESAVVLRCDRAENLALRTQLAGLIERGIKPKRANFATRVSLAVFTQCFDWRAAVVNIRASSIIRWHPLGSRIAWLWKNRPGRPAIPLEPGS